jgi:hypothetical protein
MIKDIGTEGLNARQESLDAEQESIDKAQAKIDQAREWNELYRGSESTGPR